MIVKESGDTPAILGLPLTCLAVEMGDVEAPNLRTVEAKQKAKWPPRGQATEQRRGHGQLPREVLYKRGQNNLKSIGTSTRHLQA